MRPVTLTQPSAAILSLQDEMRRGAELRYGHRLHAVLLVAQGMPCRQVARLFGDASGSVGRWVRRFEAHGPAGLREDARRGRPPRLAPREVAEVYEAFQSRPSDFGLSGDRWDATVLAAYIEQTYGVKLGARQCRRVFRRWALQMLRKSELGNRH